MAKIKGLSGLEFFDFEGRDVTTIKAIGDWADLSAQALGRLFHGYEMSRNAYQNLVSRGEIVCIPCSKENRDRFGYNRRSTPITLFSRTAVLEFRCFLAIKSHRLESEGKLTIKQLDPRNIRQRTA